MATVINVQVNPTLDIAKFNAIINSIKNSFTGLEPIDSSKLVSSLKAIKPEFVGIVSNAKSLNDALGTAKNSTDKLAQSGGLVSKAFNFNNIVQSVSAVSNALGSITQVGIDFESNLAAVSSITGATGSQLETLGKSARTLAKDFGGSANEQLKSFQGILSKLGPAIGDNPEALGLLAKNVNVLSAASGDDAATSMSTIADAMLQLGLASGTPMEQAKNSTDVINALAASAKVGAAEIPQVGQSLLAAGVAAKGANLDLVDVNAAIQVLAVGGKTGAEAGTALRNVLGLMQKASGPAADAMAKLGTSSDELGKLLTEEGLDVALNKIQVGMQGLGSDAERNATLIKIFGAENASAAGIMLQNGDKFKEFSDGIREGMTGQGSAFEQASIRMNTASNIISRVQANISDAFIGLSQSVGQGVTALIGSATQIAPLIVSLSGISQAIPDGAFDNLISGARNYATTILNFVVPGLVTQNAETGALIFSSNALTLANIRQSIATKAKLALDYLQSTAIYGLVAGQMSLNAAMAANPIGLVIAGAVALGAALYLLYDNVESVRNVFDGAWDVIVVGAKVAWEALKAYGSMLAEIGGMVYEFISIPFKMAWSVISGIGSAIGSIFGETLGFGTDLTSIFNVISGVGSSVINIFNQVKAVIAGVTAVVGSVVDTVSTGVSQLLTLDFGGFIDTVSNAGDNASKAFSDTFNAKMRTAKFEEAKKSIETQLSQGEGINAKIKAQVDFTETVKQYELVQKQIEELSAKKSSGVISVEDSKKLDELQKSAQKYATDIQKIAPETVKSFKAVIDANGNITNSYDINIAKAKEFATANDYTDTLNNQKKAVSDNVSSMANTYSQQTDVVKQLQAELAKPVTDEKAYIKLKESFAEAQAQAETMKNELVDNFTKAGTAGLLTDNAIKSVAKSLKITNEEAKGKLLASELKSASEAGVITEKQISKLADKYKVSQDEVRQIFDKQKQITAETLKTQQATEGWNSALDRIKGEQKKALDAVKDAQLQYKKGLITKEQLDITTAESEAKISGANKEIAVLSDVNKEIAKNKNLRIDEIKDVKESTKETTKQAKEQKTAYEILRDKLQLSENELTSEREKTISKREQTRLDQGLTTSAKQSLIDKKADLATEKSILEQRKINAKTLIDSAEKSIKDKEKLSTELIKLNDDINKIDASISKVNIEGLKIEADLTLNDKEFKAKLEQSKLDVSRETLEFQIKIGEIPQSELIKFDLTNKIFDKDKLTQDLKEANDLMNKNLASGLDVTDNLIAIDTIDKAQKKSIIDVYNLRKQLETQLDNERITKIADTDKRILEQSLADAKRIYAEELNASLGSTELKTKALQKYTLAVNNANMKYLSDTNILVKSTQLLASGMQNISFKVSSQGVNEAKKSLSEVEKSITDLRNSYNAGTVSYEEYQKKLTELQKNESDARVRLDQAEADKRRQVWGGFSDVFVGMFSNMYEEYSKKATISLNKVMEIHQLEFERKKQLVIAESINKTAIENGNIALQLSSSTVRMALQNQEAENQKKNSEAMSEAYTNLGISAGSMFGQMIADNENFGKAFLSTSLSVVKALVPIFAVKIMGEELSKLGPIGLITAAGLMTTMYAVLGLAESAVQGAFKDGVVNFKGKGTGTSDSNAVLISDGESIITSKASSMPINQKYMSYMNKTGGDLYGFIKANPNIKNEIISDDLKKYYSNIELQKIQLNQLIMEREKSEKLVNEIQKDRIMLQKQLKEINDTLKTTKFSEFYTNYNIKSTNNVVKEVAQLDLGRC